MKGAKLIRGVLGLGDLAAIGVAQRDRDWSLREGVIVAAVVVERSGDPLVEHGLARPVDAAIGDEHDRRTAALLISLPDMRRFRGRRVRLPRERGLRHEQEFPPLLGGEFVAAVGVGRGRTPLDEPGRVTLFLADEHHCSGPGDGLARGDVDHMARESRGPLAVR